MTKANFRQADIERLIKAAKKCGATIQVNLRTLVVTIYPNGKEGIEPSVEAPDGKENWDDMLTLEKWRNRHKRGRGSL
ncbi:hypothetical protein [Martelella limonii]|uniref:hypothetical protein n=1 Tax=Martelella limonii TaxID=1647649 RepID=UPI00157FD293|nr:hypothetical protein [Martelella limonii]